MDFRPGERLAAEEVDNSADEGAGNSDVAIMRYCCTGYWYFTVGHLRL